MCETCGHTMQRLGDITYWCPRCGTLKTKDAVPEYEPPALAREVYQYKPSDEERNCIVEVHLWSDGSFMRSEAEAKPA